MRLRLALLFALAGLIAPGLAAADVHAVAAGAFIDTPGFILGDLTTTDKIYRVAIYSTVDAQGQPATRALAVRFRWSVYGTPLETLDDVLLPADALQMNAHPTRAGIWVLTFQAQLPNTGAWDLRFAAMLRPTTTLDHCIGNSWVLQDGRVSTNLPSYDSSIAGDSNIGLECARWGRAADGEYALRAAR